MGLLDMFEKHFFRSGYIEYNRVQEVAGFQKACENNGVEFLDR